MATRFQNVVSGVITTIFIEKALKNETIEDYDLIFENLYMSNLEQSCNPSLLIKNNITHVLSVCQAKNAFENGLEEAFSGVDLDEKGIEMLDSWKGNWKNIIYERIAIADKPKVNIYRMFAKAINFIDEVLATPGKKLLLHCQAGISRSGTICIAYLMSKGMTLDEAFILASSKRKIIRPNPGFAIALLKYQEDLYPGTDSPIFKKALNL